MEKQDGHHLEIASSVEVPGGVEGSPPMSRKGVAQLIVSVLCLKNHSIHSVEAVLYLWFITTSETTGPVTPHSDDDLNRRASSCLISDTTKVRLALKSVRENSHEEDTESYKVTTVPKSCNSPHPVIFDCLWWDGGAHLRHPKTDLFSALHSCLRFADDSLPGANDGDVADEWHH